MLKAIRYHRFSTKRQDKGSSLERQDEATARMCEAKGWTVVETHQDLGRSAWKGDHLSGGELGKLRARIDSGEFDPGTHVIVIENLDRLSRQNARIARRWVEDVVDRGVIVAVCNPELTLDAGALSGENLGSMVQYLLEAGRANKESERKSVLLKGARVRWLDKARNGEVYTKRGPLWLRVEGGKWVADPERAAVIEQIYRWGETMGLASIAERLNGSVKGWSKGWKNGTETWKLGYIRDILTSPAVEGDYVVRSGDDRSATGEVIRGYYPRVVSADQVERTRSAMLSRRGTGGANHSEAKNLFAGVCRCGECGQAMTRVINHSKGRVYEYFLCRAAREKACSNTTQFRYDLFEKAALEQVLHLALDSTYFVKSDEVGPLAATVADLRKAMEGLEGEQANLIAVLRKLPDSDAIVTELGKVEADLRTTRDRLAEGMTALDRARGNVSPDEHLKRVLEVRDAIHSDDTEAREQARRLVREAIGSVVLNVWFDREWVTNLKAQRSVLMVLRGAHLGFKFDGSGNLVERIDYTEVVRPGSDLSNRMIGLDRDLAQARGVLTDIVRRKASAAT